jgi:hypothetical protein
MLALALWLAAAATTATAEPAAAMDVRLEVTAARRVPELEVRRLARQVEVGLSRPDCPVRLVDEDEPYEVLVSLRIVRLRRTEEPASGGVWDPQTGRDRRDTRHTVEIRAELELTEPGRKKPLVEKELRASNAVSSGGNWRLDAERMAQQAAVRRLVDKVRRRVCGLAERRL